MTEKRIVLITGCAGGIGMALVKKFISKNYVVIATMRRMNERKSLYQQISSENLFLKELDIASQSQIEALISWIKSDLGKLDILINNAGYGVYGLYEDLSVNDMRKQFETNVFGTFALTQACLPLLKNGQLFVVSSIIGRVPMAMASAYCSSKYALEGLYETASFELRYHGIETCLIGPGKFKSEFTKNLVFPEKYQKAQESIPYQKLRENLHNVESSRGAEPEQVARKIYNLSLKKKLPLRVAVGYDAMAMSLLESILPHRLFFALLDFAYRFALGVRRR